MCPRQHPGVPAGSGSPAQAEQRRGLGTRSVSERQGWRCVRAARLRAGCGSRSPVYLPAHQILRGWGWDTERGDCVQSCGETMICASGGEKSRFLSVFYFEDISRQCLCPETLENGHPTLLGTLGASVLRAAPANAAAGGIPHWAAEKDPRSLFAPDKCFLGSR